jgi:hypothetical protein
METRSQGKCVQGGPYGANDRAANELSTRLVAAPGQVTHGVIIMASKKNSPEPLGPGELLNLRLESIAVANIDRAVGAPLPAAVINVEMMAMAVMMTMPMMMTMTVVPVMAVTSTMPTMPTVAAMPTVTVTASERLTRYCQRSSGQRQRSNRGGNDRLDLRHGRLLDWAERGSPCD